MTGPHECPVCRRRFATAPELAAHTCRLGEEFFKNAIARWRAAGVAVYMQPTDYDAPADGATTNGAKP
jgi:hypothetical protein